MHSIRNQLFFISCCLFAFSLLFPIRLNNIAIGIMIIGAILSPSGYSLITDRSMVLKILPLILIYFIYLLSFVYSENFSEWKQHAEVKSTFFILPLLFLWRGGLITQERRDKIFTCFIVGVIGVCIVLLMIAAYKYQQTGVTSYFYYHELCKPFGLHAIYLANYLTVVILIILHQPTLFFLGKIRLIKIAIVLFAICIIFLLSALTAMAFLAIWLTMLILRDAFSKSWNRLALLIGLLSLSLLIVFSMPYTKTKISKLYTTSYNMEDPDYAWNSLTIRLAMWHCATEVVRNNLLLGVGSGDEQDVLMKSYEQNNFKEGIRCRYNSHNQYLSTFIAIGIPGMFLLLLMLIQPLYGVLQTHDYLLAGYIVLTIIGLVTENIFSLQKGTIMFSFLFVMLNLPKTNQFSIDRKIS